MISIVTFIVAFCSIVYELVLGQMLSAFLGNTILRYSVTIGLYLFSMGFGAMFAEGRWIKRPINSFLIIELLLTFFGGFSIILLFVVEGLFSTGLLFSCLAHPLIILIGILTGFEIPLLIALGKKYINSKEYIILGIDYLGAFFGSIVFSFIFYSRLGLIPTVFLTAFLNGTAGLMIYIYSRKKKIKEKKSVLKSLLFSAQLFFTLIMLLGMVFSGKINDYFIELFIK